MRDDHDIEHWNEADLGTLMARYRVRQEALARERESPQWQADERTRRARLEREEAERQAPEAVRARREAAWREWLASFEMFRPTELRLTLGEAAEDLQRTTFQPFEFVDRDSAHPGGEIRVTSTTEAVLAAPTARVLEAVRQGILHAGWQTFPPLTPEREAEHEALRQEMLKRMIEAGRAQEEAKRKRGAVVRLGYGGWS